MFSSGSTSFLDKKRKRDEEINRSRGEKSEYGCLVNCPLCSCLFTDPRVLPCGHSGCFHCIEQTVSSACPRCPLCSADLRALSVSSLPRNDVVVLLMNRNQQTEPHRVIVKTEHHLCFLCADKPACVSCDSCAAAIGSNGFLCFQCDQSEHMSKLGKLHKPRVSLEDALRRAARTQCGEHRKERKFFCGTPSCQSQPFLCATCVDNHTAHNVMSYAKRSDAVREDLKRDLKTLSDVCSLQKEKEILLKTREAFETELAEVRRKLEEADSLLQEFGKREEKVKITQIVLEKMIEGLGVDELMNESVVKGLRECMHSTSKELHTETVQLDISTARMNESVAEGLRECMHSASKELHTETVQLDISTVRMNESVAEGLRECMHSASKELHTETAQLDISTVRDNGKSHSYDISEDRRVFTKKSGGRVSISADRVIQEWAVRYKSTRLSSNGDFSLGVHSNPKCAPFDSFNKPGFIGVTVRLNENSTFQRINGKSVRHDGLNVSVGDVISLIANEEKLTVTCCPNNSQVPKWTTQLNLEKGCLYFPHFCTYETSFEFI
jgi:hypothetical protein